MAKPGWKKNVPIDPEQVRKMAGIGCTQEEIGQFFGVDDSTISRRFAKEFALGRASCKTSLRRMQWKKARSGCTPMLIHMGKQYLGQSDKVETKGTVDVALEWPDDHNGNDDEGEDAPASSGPVGSQAPPGPVQGAGVRPEVGEDEAGGGAVSGDGS